MTNSNDRRVEWSHPDPGSRENKRIQAYSMQPPSSENPMVAQEQQPERTPQSDIKTSHEAPPHHVLVEC